MRETEPAPLAPRHRSLLVVHGAAGVLVGLLGGMAFVFNILRFIEVFPLVPRIQKQVPGTEAAWRAAHTGPIMNGMLAMGVSASGSMIELTPRAQRSLVAAMIVIGPWFSKTNCIFAAAAKGRRISNTRCTRSASSTTSCDTDFAPASRRRTSR